MHSEISMSIRALLLTTLALTALSSPAFAQAEITLEGKMTGTTPVGKANNAVAAITVFNTTVSVPTGKIFSTPTRDGLNRSDIGACNATPFAGQDPTTAKSLLGGTAIIVGTSADDANGKSVITPTSIFVEPAENVLLGRITNVPTFKDIPKTEIDPKTNQPKTITVKEYDKGTLEIEGTSVVVLGKVKDGHFPPYTGVAHNDCVPGLGIKNDAGFELPPEALAKNADAAAEGWYGSDGRFYAFLIETVGAAPDQKTAVSISRAQCRQRTATQMEWEVRGGTADPVDKGAGRVTIGYGNADGSGVTMYGVNTTATADPVNPPYGLYTYKGNITGTATISGTCPQTVVVAYNGVRARAGVDIR
jgi:hypothetical protein